MNIIEMIEKYNLAIRRIPNNYTETYDIRHFKDGDIIIEKFGRKFVQRTIIPNNAGKYMVKQVNNNMSTVTWNVHKDNLADTLEDSINLFLYNNINILDITLN